MISWHRHQFAAVSLLVYLFSVLGGGLHHHDHGEACCAEKSSQLGSRPIEKPRHLPSNVRSPQSVSFNNPVLRLLCPSSNQLIAL